MNKDLTPADRPDIVAATRGGDHSLGMEGEGDPTAASVGEATFWRDIYAEITAMEDSVLARVRQLMEAQTPQARQEVELTNVPVIAAQAERFRARLGYWQDRLDALSAQRVGSVATTDTTPG